MTGKTYTHSEVETALCVWEWMLETCARVDQHGAPNDQRPLHLQMVELFEAYGTGGMRMTCVQAAQSVDAVWDAYAEAHGGVDQTDISFDWEFVPWVCNMLDWPQFAKDNQYGNQLWQPVAKEIAAVLIAREAMKV